MDRALWHAMTIRERALATGGSFSLQLGGAGNKVPRANAAIGALWARPRLCLASPALISIRGTISISCIPTALVRPFRFVGRSSYSFRRHAHKAAIRPFDRDDLNRARESTYLRASL